MEGEGARKEKAEDQSSPGKKKGRRFWWRQSVVESGWLGGLAVVSLVLVAPFWGKSFDYAFSVPLIPVLDNLVGLILPFWDGARMESLLLIFYALGSVTYYFLVREVAERRLSGLLAVVFYILVFSRARLRSLLVFGDGAHVAALTLIPLVSFGVIRFLKRGGFWRALWSSVGVALVALVSPFGLVSLLIFLLVLFFSEILLGQGRLKILRMMLVLFLAGGLSTLWYNPGFIRLVFLGGVGEELVVTFYNLLPLSMFMMPVLGVFGFLLFERRPRLQPLFISLFLTVFFGLVVFAGHLGKFYISSPERYLPELGMAISFLLAVVLMLAYDVWGLLPDLKQWRGQNKEGRKREAVRVGLMGLLLLVSGWALLKFPRSLEMLGEKPTVLGAASGLVGEIWEIRRSTTVFERLFGYMISGGTVVLMGVLGMKFGDRGSEEERG